MSSRLVGSSALLGVAIVLLAALWWLSAERWRRARNGTASGEFRAMGTASRVPQPTAVFIDPLVRKFAQAAVTGDVGPGS